MQNEFQEEILSSHVSEQRLKLQHETQLKTLRHHTELSQYQSLVTLGTHYEANMHQQSGDSMRPQQTEKPQSGPYLLGENFKRLNRVAHCID